uniref:Uncharacterized protein n=1 Tax=viral metagenome TaxID=1070528 RepID=A0A6M3LR53_9ZZZZ
MDEVTRLKKELKKLELKFEKAGGVRKKRLLKKAEVFEKRLKTLTGEEE